MPVFAPAFNPRKRYLSALGNPAAARGPAVFHVPAPQAHLIAAAAGGGTRSRRRLRGYDPRARYLTGFGQDSTDTGTPAFDWNTAIQQMDTSPPVSASPDYNVITPASPPNLTLPISSQTPGSFVPAGTYGSVATPGTSVTYTPSGSMVLNVPAPAGSSFWSGSTLGLPNTIVLAGLGGIALLALLSSSKGRR